MKAGGLYANTDNGIGIQVNAQDKASSDEVSASLNSINAESTEPYAAGHQAAPEGAMDVYNPKAETSPTAPLQSSGTPGNKALWAGANSLGQAGSKFQEAGKGLTGSTFYQALQQWSKPGATPSQQTAAGAARRALETTTALLSTAGNTPQANQKASSAQKEFWQAKLAEDKNWVASDPSNPQAQAAVKATQGALDNFTQNPHYVQTQF